MKRTLFKIVMGSREKRKERISKFKIKKIKRVLNWDEDLNDQTIKIRESNIIISNNESLFFSTFLFFFLNFFSFLSLLLLFSFLLSTLSSSSFHYFLFFQLNNYLFHVHFVFFFLLTRRWSQVPLSLTLKISPTLA